MVTNHRNNGYIRARRARLFCAEIAFILVGWLTWAGGEDPQQWPGNCDAQLVIVEWTHPTSNYTYTFEWAGSWTTLEGEGVLQGDWVDMSEIIPDGPFDLDYDDHYPQILNSSAYLFQDGSFNQAIWDSWAPPVSDGFARAFHNYCGEVLQRLDPDNANFYCPDETLPDECEYKPVCDDACDPGTFSGDICVEEQEQEESEGGTGSGGSPDPPPDTDYPPGGGAPGGGDWPPNVPQPPGGDDPGWDNMPDEDLYLPGYGPYPPEIPGTPPYNPENDPNNDGTGGDSALLAQILYYVRMIKNYTETIAWETVYMESYFRTYVGEQFPYALYRIDQIMLAIMYADYHNATWLANVSQNQVYQQLEMTNQGNRIVDAINGIETGDNQDLIDYLEDPGDSVDIYDDVDQGAYGGAIGTNYNRINFVSTRLAALEDYAIPQQISDGILEVPYFDIDGDMQYAEINIKGTSGSPMESLREFCRVFIGIMCVIALFSAILRDVQKV